MNDTIHTQALRQKIGPYLEALDEQHKPTGRRTPQFIEERLSQIDARLSTNSITVLARLRLIQDRIDLLATAKQHDRKGQLDELEKLFVEACPLYSERKGISYKAWREVGVPAKVLAEAGITR